MPDDGTPEQAGIFFETSTNLLAGQTAETVGECLPQSRVHGYGGRHLDTSDAKVFVEPGAQ